MEPGELVAVAMPLSISTFEMPVPPHDKVAVPPVWILAGLTLIEQLGPPPPPLVVTVTAVVQVAVWPVGLITVPVKVVLPLIASEETEPPVAGVTSPIPLSIENVFGFVVVQVRVV